MTAYADAVTNVPVAEVLVIIVVALFLNRSPGRHKKCSTALSHDVAANLA